MASHRPADDAAGASVEDEDEVEEPFSGGQVRYVGQPEAIWGGSEKAAVHEAGAGAARSSRRVVDLLLLAENLVFPAESPEFLLLVGG